MMHFAWCFFRSSRWCLYQDTCFWFCAPILTPTAVPAVSTVSRIHCEGRTPLPLTSITPGRRQRELSEQYRASRRDRQCDVIRELLHPLQGLHILQRDTAARQEAYSLSWRTASCCILQQEVYLLLIGRTAWLSFCLYGHRKKRGVCVCVCFVVFLKML